MSLFTTECLYKSFCFINSSVPSNICQVELKILRNSSTIFRSSHRRIHKKAILKHRKTVLGSLFNKVAGHQASNFIKKRIQHRYFLVNIGKFVRTPILENIWEWLHFWKGFCENIFQIRT